MSYTILDILKIKTEEDLFAAVDEFDKELTCMLAPLREKLKMQVLTQEVPELALHMTYVESWRDRVCKLLSLASTFVEHGKSSTFQLSPGKGVTTSVIDAHMKAMTKGFIGVKVDLENLVDSIDSRTNLCKILLRLEGDCTNISNGKTSYH